MKRLLILIFLFSFLFLFHPLPSYGISCNNGSIRCAECDKCGYCYASQTAPGNWRQCASCLYSGIPTTAPATDNYSLEIKPDTKTGILEQVTPAAGKYYTQLGCINTEMSSFTDPTAAGGVLNFLLTRLFFPTVGVLSFLSLIYGAFLLITAQGDPERIQRGRSYIIGAIVGLIFTLSIVLIINTLAGDILKIPGFSQSTQATIAVNGTTSVFNGKTMYPVLGVSYQGKEIQSLTLNAGDQNININIPVPPQDLVKPEVLNNIVFTMKNDHCNSISSRDRALCCDCAQDISAIDPAYRTSWREKCAARPLTASRIAECRDRTNYNGDVNLYISSITINGKKCTKYSLNGNPVNPTFIISNTGASVRCTSI